MRIARLLLTASPFLVAGCSLFEDDDVPSLALNAAVAPIDLRIGDTAWIAIDVTNGSLETVPIGEGGCNMDFVLTDASGRSYHPAELVYCTLELRAPVQLSPGATYRINGFTTGRVVPQGSQAEPAYLPPGTYAVRAQVWVKRGDGIVIRSNPMSITFRAAS